MRTVLQRILWASFLFSISQRIDCFIPATFAAGSTTVRTTSVSKLTSNQTTDARESSTAHHTTITSSDVSTETSSDNSTTTYTDISTTTSNYNNTTKSTDISTTASSENNPTASTDVSTTASSDNNPTTSTDVSTTTYSDNNTTTPIDVTTEISYNCTTIVQNTETSDGIPESTVHTPISKGNKTTATSTTSATVTSGDQTSSTLLETLTNGKNPSAPINVLTIVMTSVAALEAILLVIVILLYCRQKKKLRKKSVITSYQPRNDDDHHKEPDCSASSNNDSNCLYLQQRNSSRSFDDERVDQEISSKDAKPVTGYETSSNVYVSLPKASVSTLCEDEEQPGESHDDVATSGEIIATGTDRRAIDLQVEDGLFDSGNVHYVHMKGASEQVEDVYVVPNAIRNKPTYVNLENRVTESGGVTRVENVVYGNYEEC